MSTTSSSSKKNDPDKSTQPVDGSGKPKKRKSAGFIESADFKPNWLETGPLSPEMLPESLSQKKGDLTPDEIEALQNSLQRFYEETGEPVPEAFDPAMTQETRAEEEPPGFQGHMKTRFQARWVITSWSREQSAVGRIERYRPDEGGRRCVLL